MLSPMTISRTLTMNLCLAKSRVLISRSDVIGKPSFSFSILSLLSATMSPVAVSRALYTTPYAPSSILLSFS